MNIRTDLAMEAYELLTETADEIAGIGVKKEQINNTEITRVEVKTKDAAKKLGKPEGNYVTVEVSDVSMLDSDKMEALCQLLANEIKALANLKKDSTVLVIGLGNRNVTPDALGPEVISCLMVTRHMLEYMPEQMPDGIRSVCAISPGVLGITGIETEEIVRGVTEKIKPNLVICIDALAARSIKRISRTIQICDTGIAPGAGVGNKRRALNRQTLGVPVIAIGVPTVIDAATITSDSLLAVTDSLKKSAKQGSEFYNMLSKIDEDEQFALIKEALYMSNENFIVTPKDVDLMIEKTAKIVANGINLALHEDISLEDVEMYVG
ncbi:MAG: GPR endopeptidase [Clostridia bacterium]|nr:GPR endopeptidase [Clostridia bacterium]